MVDKPKGNVNVGESADPQPITLSCVSLFSNRPGYCIVATMTQPGFGDGNARTWELTKQFKTPQGAMDAFASFLRKQTVEMSDE